MPEKGTGPLPVVMYVHGGGFACSRRRPTGSWRWPSPGAGYLVFNINYRLGPGTSIPRRSRTPASALSGSTSTRRSTAGTLRGSPSPERAPGGNLVTALAVACSLRRPEPFARQGVRRRHLAPRGRRDLRVPGPRPHREYLAHPRMSRWAKALLLDAARSLPGPRRPQRRRGAPAGEPPVASSRAADARPPGAAVLRVGRHQGPAAHLLEAAEAGLDALGAECELHVAPGEIHGYDAMAWRPRRARSGARPTPSSARHLRAAEGRGKLAARG